MRLEGPRSINVEEERVLAALLSSEAGERVADILLFVDDGRLSYLELVWYTDDAPKTWPLAAQITVEPTDAA
jgi:hypothetical protein